MRKNVKDSDDKGGDAADINPDEVAGPGGEAGAGPMAGGMIAGRKNKKAKVGLPWEVGSLYMSRFDGTSSISRRIKQTRQPPSVFLFLPP